MSIEVKVPVLPESVADATVATWHKKVGDKVYVVMKILLIWKQIKWFWKFLLLQMAFSTEILV